MIHYLAASIVINISFLSLCFMGGGAENHIYFVRALVPKFGSVQTVHVGLPQLYDCF